MNESTGGAPRKPEVCDDARIETIRQAHANAMMALGADVHPYSASAIREWEAEMDAALDAVAAELAATREALEPFTEVANWTTNYDGVGVIFYLGVSQTNTEIAIRRARAALAGSVAE